MALSNELDAYKLYDQLTLVEGAALILGIPPVEVDYSDWNGGEYYIISNEYSHMKNKLNVMLGALLNSLEKPNNGAETKITTSNLREWLISKNWPSEFFGTGENQPQPIESNALPPYLDPKHEHYSQELAGAVYAWLAFEGVNANSGKSVKASISEWINDNLKSWGITDTAITRMSEVSNWHKTGGQPKTTSERANPKTLEELQACFKPIRPIAEKKTVKLRPMNYTPPPKFF